MRERVWRDTALRVVLPVVTIAITLFAAQQRQLSFAEDLGLRLPGWRVGVAWSALFIGVTAVTELLSRRVGVARPAAWGAEYSARVKAVRVFAMVVLAPIAEELLFRGLIYGQVATSALNGIGAIVVSTVAFGLLHVQLNVRQLAFVVGDGLFYGIARYATESTILTMVLHSLGNSYAAYQRLVPAEPASAEIERNPRV